MEWKDFQIDILNYIYCGIVPVLGIAERELPPLVEEVQVLGDGKVETDGNEVE